MIKEGPGRPRSADSILMSIKALVLEFEQTLFTETDQTYPRYIVDNFVARLKLAFNRGTGMAAKYWLEKIEEIEREMRR